MRRRRPIPMPMSRRLPRAPASRASPPTPSPRAPIAQATSITGGLSTKGNSSLAGNGVTLYVQGGGSINANSTVGITAPTTGTYAGLAVWFGDGSDVTWNGGNTSAFKGAIYAPTSTVTYEGNAASASTCTRLVGGSIELAGTSNAVFDNSGCPTVAGPVLSSSGVVGGTTYTGSPM